MELQKTIAKEIELKGVGLHTGEKVTVRFKPSMPEGGVNFVRVDIPGRPMVRGHISKIVDLARSPRRSSIKEGDVEVQTIEHLMAALSGLGIDNIVVELDGEELPGLDGSASGFVEALKAAGIQEQDLPRKFFQVREPIWIEEDDASLVILPGSEFKVSYALSYDHPQLNSQYISLALNRELFEREIAPARTFCLEQEAQGLLERGLGKGANYQNTLVLGERGIIQNKLRFRDEFARHKILDLIGDLYLLGVHLKGHVVAVKSGHPSNLKLLQKIFQQRERWREGGVKAVDYQAVRPQMDVTAIQKILPHRYPFMLVDKIIELEEQKRIVGIKNVTINDYFFRGHFPGRPVMPGVLIVEAMAQTAGILILCRKESAGKLAYFMGIDNVRFRKTVVPGDQLVIEVEAVRLKSKTGMVHARSLVEGKLVAEAELMFSLVEV